jgi:dynein heavy chain
MMQRGGAPQGPAGTGKTETVKDLGKNLALFVIIQNCSDTLDYISLGKIFAGLALSGSWGCFDEFNRIQLEVLSVVAQTIQIILDAIRKDEALTQLNEQGIHVEKETGLFITMNPGYAGRSELPDNLASLFRPVAMMIPDFVTICKISLMSEGFKQNDVLAKKVFTIYDLMKKQLSKQDHYDFNMRAIKSVLNASGRIKRQLPEHDELTVMIKALRDMNLPKFIAEDVILFDNLFIDLFPGCEEPEADTDELQIEIENAMIAKGLYLNEATIVKVMQLYEYKKTRHGNMLVGLSMSGKTTAWEILNDALNVLHKKELEKDPSKKDKENSTMTYPAVKYELINPKSITIRELYGDFDEGQPPQWVDGILSSILKKICQESKNEQRWMILDGPVDTLWIESMNSVLDDSKLLTLNNGDRIALSPSVRLLFEVENLAVASPATVSRAGMIYVDIDELGWRPLMTQWIKSKEGAEYRELLQKLVEEYVPKVLSVKKTQCTELVPTNEASCVKNLCNLYDALCSNLTRLEDEEEEAFNEYIGKWFVFCLIWSIGATVDEASRKNIDYILRDINSIFPHSNTVFEHYINLEKHDFAPWDEKLPPNWKPNTTDFTQINVPTVDVVRNRFITNALLDKGSQINMVGHSGVGKTVLVERILQALDIHVHSFTINFSAGTTSQSVQDIIESNFERRAKNKYRPKNAKHKAICFIDDLNMPRKDTFGS